VEGVINRSDAKVMSISDNDRVQKTLTEIQQDGPGANGIMRYWLYMDRTGTVRQWLTSWPA
jgi:hypothetical protein